MKVNIGNKGGDGTKKSRVTVAKDLKRKSTFLYKGQKISGDGSSRQVVNQVMRGRVK